MDTAKLPAVESGEHEESAALDVGGAPIASEAMDDFRDVMLMAREMDRQAGIWSDENV